MTDIDDTRFMVLALEQAKKSRNEGGVPVGAAFVVDGEVRGVGHNQRVQLGSVIRHGETDCLENIGRLPASVYRRGTLYTTLSPCSMCTGTILLYGIGRVVIGESATFTGPEHLLREAGVEIVPLDDPACVEMMRAFIAEKPELWHEDIGVDDETSGPGVD
ncbi:MAG: nucleoside deaminase [Nocardioidaceae bacterium]